MTDPSYADRLDREATFWGSAAAEQAATTIPEWDAHRQLRHNAIQFTPHIDALLERVRPGMRVLELGCGPGWLTLAMARRGAIAHGVDIAHEAIEIARARVAAVAHDIPGTASYTVADLNDFRASDGVYDLVVAKGVLHHLPNAERAIACIHDSLVDGGLFWTCDIHGGEALATAVAAGALMFVLPTHVSYADKLRGLLRFGLKSPDRIRASMEARGLSPFEGAGRDVDWPGAIDRHFIVESKKADAAITGYIAAQLSPSDRTVMPFLRLLRAADQGLVRAGVLRSTGLVIYATKRRRSR